MRRIISGEKVAKTPLLDLQSSLSPNSRTGVQSVRSPRRGNGKLDVSNVLMTDSWPQALSVSGLIRSKRFFAADLNLSRAVVVARAVLDNPQGIHAVCLPQQVASHAMTL